MRLLKYKGILPTKREYFENIRKIQESELKSDRYASAYSFMNDNNYWNRENIALEEELFKIIRRYGIEDCGFNMSDHYIKNIRLRRYVKLKCFLDSLTEEQINSNIFLKNADLFMKTSAEDCSIILKQILDNVLDNEIKIKEIEIDIPEQIKIYFSRLILTKTIVKHYDPKEYEVAVCILDDSHKYVYEDYNKCVDKIQQLAEAIYHLQLNNMTLSSDIICTRLKINIYSEDEKYFSIVFFRCKKVRLDKPEFLPFDSNDDFIETTVKNFQALLDMGLIDTKMLKDKDAGHVLCKTLNNKRK